MDVKTVQSGETAPVYTEIRMKPFLSPQSRFVADGDHHRQVAQGVAVVRDEDLVEGDTVGDAGSVHFPLERSCLKADPFARPDHIEWENAAALPIRS